MVSKKAVMVAALAVVVLIAVAGFTMLAKPAANAPAAQPANPNSNSPAAAPSSQPQAGAGTVTPDEASVLSTQTDTLLAEQVSAVPVDTSGFASSMQDDMSADSSQFLYK